MTTEKNSDKKINRRGILKGISAVSVGAVSSASLAQSLCRTPTAQQTEGPFYPVEDQVDTDFDLTKVTGNPEEAFGEAIIIKGTVLDQNCTPVEGALVEIWQACHSGRYRHPSDPNTEAELDPNFQYWGKAITDADGDYMFKTVRPGQYPANSNWIRPSHVHFKIAKRGYQELTTQLYFAGDPYNSDDRILQSLNARDRRDVVIDFQFRGDVELPVGIFDLVLKKLD